MSGNPPNSNSLPIPLPIQLQFYSNENGWVSVDPDIPISQQPLIDNWFRSQSPDMNGFRTMFEESGSVQNTSQIPQQHGMFLNFGAPNMTGGIGNGSPPPPPPSQQPYQTFPLPQAGMSHLRSPFSNIPPPAGFPSQFTNPWAGGQSPFPLFSFRTNMSSPSEPSNFPFGPPGSTFPGPGPWMNPTMIDFTTGPAPNPGSGPSTNTQPKMGQDPTSNNQSNHIDILNDRVRDSEEDQVVGLPRSTMLSLASPLANGDGFLDLALNKSVNNSQYARSSHLVIPDKVPHGKAPTAPTTATTCRHTSNTMKPDTPIYESYTHEPLPNKCSCPWLQSMPDPTPAPAPAIQPSSDMCTCSAPFQSPSCMHFQDTLWPSMPHESNPVYDTGCYSVPIDHPGDGLPNPPCAFCTYPSPMSSQMPPCCASMESDEYDLIALSHNRLHHPTLKYSAACEQQSHDRVMCLCSTDWNAMHPIEALDAAGAAAARHLTSGVPIVRGSHSSDSLLTAFVMAVGGKLDEKLKLDRARKKESPSNWLDVIEP